MPSTSFHFLKKCLAAPLTSVICGITEIRITWLKLGFVFVDFKTVCPILKQKEQRRRIHQTQYGLKAALTCLH